MNEHAVEIKRVRERLDELKTSIEWAEMKNGERTRQRSLSFLCNRNLKYEVENCTASYYQAVISAHSELRTVKGTTLERANIRLRKLHNEFRRLGIPKGL